MRKLAFFSVWMLVFAIPWENIVFLPGLGTASRVLGLWAIFIGVAAVLILKQEIRIHALHWSLLGFVWLAALSYFWSIAPENTLGRVWTYLQLLIMTWVIYQFAARTKDLNAFLCAYVLGAYISVFSTFSNFLRGNTAVWERYAASGFNPNDIAIILALGIPMAWYLVQIKWGRLMKWPLRLYPFLAPISIALTGSRTGMIVTVVALSYVLWTASRLPTRYKLGFLAAVWAAFWIGIYFVPPEAWRRLATTGNVLLEGSWNNRVTIWKAGLEAFLGHPVLGVGAGGFKTAVGDVLGTEAASHNVYLAILVEQGLVGFAVFALILATALFSSFQMPALECKTWVTLLLMWALAASSNPWEWRKQTWLLLVLVVAHAVTLRSQKSEESSRQMVEGVE